MDVLSIGAWGKHRVGKGTLRTLSVGSRGKYPKFGLGGAFIFPHLFHARHRRLLLPHK